MLHKFFIAIFAFVIVFSSCTDSGPEETQKFDTGTFIVNQGAFTSGTGTITYTNNDVVIEDVYAKQNSGLVLGSIAQSIHKFDQKYFIAVNNAAKVTVVDATTFKYEGEIKLDLPRYFAPVGDKLYITSWTNDFKSGFINLIDHKTFKVTKSVAIDGLAEKMVEKNGLLYITVSAQANDPLNGHIVVYDTTKDEIKETIKVGDNSNDIVLDKNGDIWVICSGFSDFTDPNKNTNGSLHKITGNKSVYTRTLSNGANGLATNAAKNKLYFMMDSQVLVFDPTNTTIDPKSIANGYYFAMSMDTQNDHIFLADAKDFQKNGEIKVIDTKGNAVRTVSAGLIPGFVYFSK